MVIITSFGKEKLVGSKGLIHIQYTIIICQNYHNWFGKDTKSSNSGQKLIKERKKCKCVKI